METAIFFHEQVDKAGSQIDELCRAIEILQQALAGESERLCQRDQADMLRAMAVRVAQKVERYRRLESAAAASFNKGSLVGGVAMFVVGALGATMAGRGEFAVSFGARMAADTWKDKKSFGRVLVTIGAGGIPDDVDVVNVSRETRDTGKSETAIEDELKAGGHLPMTPESFSLKMESLERDVREGIVTLPIAARDLMLKPRTAIRFSFVRRAEEEPISFSRCDNRSLPRREAP